MDNISGFKIDMAIVMFTYEWPDVRLHAANVDSKCLQGIVWGVLAVRMALRVTGTAEQHMGRSIETNGGGLQAPTTGELMTFQWPLSGLCHPTTWPLPTATEDLIIPGASLPLAAQAPPLKLQLA